MITEIKDAHALFSKYLELFIFESLKKQTSRDYLPKDLDKKLQARDENENETYKIHYFHPSIFQQLRVNHNEERGFGVICDEHEIQKGIIYLKNDVVRLLIQ